MQSITIQLTDKEYIRLIKCKSQFSTLSWKAYILKAVVLLRKAKNGN